MNVPPDGVDKLKVRQRLEDFFDSVDVALLLSNELGILAIVLEELVVVCIPSFFLTLQEISVDIAYA